MLTYDFTLTFVLRDLASDPSQFIDALFEAGCDDAIVGVGEFGQIDLDFSREADSAGEAVNLAIAAVGVAIPGAQPIGMIRRLP